MTHVLPGDPKDSTSLVVDKLPQATSAPLHAFQIITYLEYQSMNAQVPSGTASKVIPYQCIQEMVTQAFGVNSCFVMGTTSDKKLECDGDEV